MRLEVPGSAIGEAERLDYEKEDYFDFRWWSIGDVLASAEPFDPRNCPRSSSASSTATDREPFELWS